MTSMPASAAAMNNQPGCRDRGERQDRALGFRQDVLRHIDASRTQRRHTGGTAGRHCPVFGQHFPCGRHLHCKCYRSHREPVAPLACGPKINVHKPRARIEAEAEEPNLPRCRLERHRGVSPWRCRSRRLPCASTGSRRRQGGYAWDYGRLSGRLAAWAVAGSHLTHLR